MKISAKGRYAVRVMVDLAVHNEEGYQNVKQIAQRQGISEKYLEQIRIAQEVVHSRNHNEDICHHTQICIGRLQYQLFLFYLSM